jgi:ankyrin repeat protein
MRRWRLLFIMLLLGYGLLPSCAEVQPMLPTFEASVEDELMFAAKRGDSFAVWAALAAGASANLTDQNGDSALMAAARMGHLDVAEALISYGALINQRGSRQATALILASSNDHPEMVALLLDYGADPTMKDRSGLTASDYAERRGGDDPILRLLADG